MTNESETHIAAGRRRPVADAARTSREALLDLTVEQVALRGLEHLSLRSIARAAGVSTTAIFQNFEGKADLVGAAAEQAVRRDLEFHERMRREAFGLVAGRNGFADFLATYIELRTRRSEAKFLAELLVHPHDQPQCLELLGHWHRNREAFWQDLVESQAIERRFGKLVCSYVVMEELYALALSDDPQYRMLMRETCRALVDTAFGAADGDTTRDSAAGRLGTEPFAIRLPTSGGGGQPIAERILRAAVGIINEGGVHALNQRDLARRAEVTASLIAYHYNDMKSLTTQAVWHALVQGIPSQLDPRGDTSSFPTSLPDWYQTLEAMLQVDDGQPHGFYIGLSRLSAEACLLAQRNPELVALITYLRGLEGWGTYRVSKSIDGLADTIGRDHAAAFAVWIKSHALLRIAGLADIDQARSDVARAAALILPLPRSN